MRWCLQSRALGYCGSGSKTNSIPLILMGVGFLSSGFLWHRLWAGLHPAAKQNWGKQGLAASLCNCLKGAPCSSHLIISAHLSVVSENDLFRHPIWLSTVTHHSFSHRSRPALLSTRSTPESSKFCSKSPSIFFICHKFFSSFWIPSQIIYLQRNVEICFFHESSTNYCCQLTTRGTPEWLQYLQACPNLEFNSTPSLIVGSCLMSPLSLCSIQKAFIEHWQSTKHIVLETWV